jgi:hypothetical protein
MPTLGRRRPGNELPSSLNVAAGRAVAAFSAWTVYSRVSYREKTLEFDALAPVNDESEVDS